MFLCFMFLICPTRVTRKIDPYQCSASMCIPVIFDIDDLCALWCVCSVLLHVSCDMFFCFLALKGRYRAHIQHELNIT